MVTNVEITKETRVILDNQRAKIYEVGLTPGEMSPLHVHGEDYIVYTFDDAKLRLTSLDGRTTDIDAKAGTAFFRRAETHFVQNIGDTGARVLVFQFNEWGP